MLALVLIPMLNFLHPIVIPTTYIMYHTRLAKVLAPICYCPFLLLSHYLLKFQFWFQTMIIWYRDTVEDNYNQRLEPSLKQVLKISMKPPTDLFEFIETQSGSILLEQVKEKNRDHPKIRVISLTFLPWQTHTLCADNWITSFLLTEKPPCQELSNPWHLFQTQVTFNEC